MLRKDHEVKWIIPERFSFNQIKNAITEASILASPNYSEPFSTFSFTFETTLAVVLLQKNENGDEQPISFFSKVMRNVELKYDIIEKQAHSLIQALKYFRVYVLHSSIIAYVPNGAVKNVLT